MPGSPESDDASKRGSGEAPRRDPPLDIASDRDRDRMRLTVLLVMAGVAVFLLAKLLLPFTLAIVTAGVVAVLAQGAYRKVRDRVHNGSLAALLVTVCLFVLVVVPVAGLVTVLVNDLESGVSVVVERMEELASREGEAWRALESTAAFVGLEPEELRGTLQDQASRLGSTLAGSTVGLLSGLGGWLVQGGVGLFTLFYLLRDGASFMAVGRWLIPLDDPLTDALIDKTHEVISATVLGALLVAVVQGLLGGIAFWLLGLPGPALWGAVMAFAGLLPAIGPPVVWLPTAGFLLLSGDIARGLALIAAGALVIGTVDNVLRAVLVGDRAQLHPLVVFFSVLGGLVVFGAAGFLFGPILVVVALAILEIARVALEDEGSDAILSTGSTILSQVTTTARTVDSTA